MYSLSVVKYKVKTCSRRVHPAALVLYANHMLKPAEVPTDSCADGEGARKHLLISQLSAKDRHHINLNSGRSGGSVLLGLQTEKPGLVRMMRFSIGILTDAWNHLHSYSKFRGLF